jgi:DnaK suppressor protein
MSDPISDTFAQQLRQRRADLIAQIREQRGGKVGRAQTTTDPHDEQSGDWTQLNVQRDVELALGERGAAELTAIDSALERVASGDYGLCIDCGVEIPTARLHANPIALRCLGCQDQSEHARGLPAHPSL